MSESIFFNSSDKEFCKSNILLKIDSIYDELCNTNGLKIVFLHTRNKDFSDLNLKEFAEDMDYLDFKTDIEFIKRDKTYNFINNNVINYLKTIDFSNYIKVFNKEIKRNRKNNSFSVKTYNEYKFYAGFDTEFISDIQYNARLNEIDDLNLEKTNLLNQNDKVLSYQMSLQLTDELFLNTLILNVEVGTEFNYNLVIRDTLVENLQIISDFRVNTDLFNVTLAGHKNIVDFSKVKDFVSLKIVKNSNAQLPKRLNGLICIRNCFCTTKQINLYFIDKHRHYRKTGSLHLRDSLLLNEPQSLKKLGESLDFNKLEIGNNIEKMDVFKTDNINAYIMYALQDSNIVVNFLYNYYNKGLGEKEVVPITIGSEGAKYTKKFLMETYGLTEDGFDKRFRGIDTITIENGSKKIKIKKYNDKLDDIFHSYSNHYYGGRNQTFVHGLLKGRFYDIDGSKFYPIMASIIPNIDFFDITSLATGEVKDDSFNWKDEEVGYAYVDFEYVAPQQFLTCITQATRHTGEDNGLIYTRKGKDVFTTITEIKSAYKLGCKIKIKAGIIFGVIKEEDKTKDYPLELLFKKLTEERNKYKKGTPENKFWKLVANSISGKFGQGLRHKKVYSYNADEMSETPQSKITSAPYIVELTSLGRTIITEVMNVFIIEGYRVINVVTDGFMVQSPNNKEITTEEINIIVNKYVLDDRFPSLYKWQQALIRLGEPNFLEIKHSGTELLSIKTRVTALLNFEDEELSQLSCTGYILPPQWTNFNKNEKIKEFIQLVITRKNRVKVKGKKLVNARDLRKNKGDSAKMVDKHISFNFDFKSKVIEQKEENNYITYITTSWETIEDFRAEKRFRERNKDIQIIDIKGDIKMSLLEELRGYNFKRIDKKNEYNELIEKFVITIAKTKIFYVPGLVNELDYESVKTLLSIKNINVRFNKREYGKLKLSKKIADNLDSIKSTMLRQVNSIFDEEEIKFNIIESNVNALKYANLFVKEDSKKEKKKKEKLKEKVQVEIAKEELEKVKYKS